MFACGASALKLVSEGGLKTPKVASYQWALESYGKGGGRASSGLQQVLCTYLSIYVMNKSMSFIFRKRP